MKNIPICIIPARGASKRIPCKNKKLLGGIPLIQWTIDFAKKFFPPELICISTDDDEILEIATDCGCPPPFKRPENLGLDTTTSREVMLHAINYYEEHKGLKLKKEDGLLLLQPTSPFRKEEHFLEASKIYNEAIEKPQGIDMVVSVCKAATNPYYSCYEDGNDGFLERSKGDGRWTRSQDVPQAWEHNGSIYIMNIDSLKRESDFKFKKQKKYVMEDIYSLDLDTLLDWEFAEFCFEKKLF